MSRGVAVARHRARHERAFGLDQLDLKLALHLKSTRGFYVEAGANDGVTQSNTAPVSYTHLTLPTNREV